MTEYPVICGTLSYAVPCGVVQCGAVQRGAVLGGAVLGVAVLRGATALCCPPVAPPNPEYDPNPTPGLSFNPRCCATSLWSTTATASRVPSSSHQRSSRRLVTLPPVPPVPCTSSVPSLHPQAALWACIPSLPLGRNMMCDLPASRACVLVLHVAMLLVTTLIFRHGSYTPVTSLQMASPS